MRLKQTHNLVEVSEVGATQRVHNLWCSFIQSSHTLTPGRMMERTSKAHSNLGEEEDRSSLYDRGGGERGVSLGITDASLGTSKAFFEALFLSPSMLSLPGS